MGRIGNQKTRGWVGGEPAPGVAEGTRSHEKESGEGGEPLGLEASRVGSDHWRGKPVSGEGWELVGGEWEGLGIRGWGEGRAGN